ncbi:MAG TPA: hypothetical protein PLW31_08210 [Bacteroidales bacterium]|nr:hypothetical protein [Bacteroidales bacterium]HNQ82232.1 hypothetical protein [Bacteroidales bacterium]HOX78009.1 hypothetical protein [Bacteroidales bacterium]HPI84976.1 hypothetical protein [Bacteroidales bacterium]HPM91680.1 hypothetical protein [Bacteroidales bacterium]
MDKTFTPLDIQRYLLEIRRIEFDSDKKKADSGPAALTIRNILNYSRSLNIYKTSIMGNIFHVSN